LGLDTGYVARMSAIALLVIAKDPSPGRVKTRLTPPCTPGQAAALAQAALLDTIDVVARTPASRRILVLDGSADRWRGLGLEIVAQRGTGLGQRLASAFADAGEAALLIGMDTPQLTPALLIDGMRALARPEIDAVLGRACDGGYWSVGLKRAGGTVFDGVPMSSAHTWRVQRRRMRELGLQVHEQPELRDVDTIEDARAVARQAPMSRFAGALAEIAA
jgi:rSAM/selenodomain-associated transferase 1